ncbi:restriction modification system DNA specificity subunit [Rivularia sp. IAM M-261]|nr:restriction modification system DNA specificity subunit [Rivularia sp. IAM M-261]
MTEDKDDLPELPDSWVYSKVEDVAEIIMGQSPPGESYNQEEIGTPLINGPVEFGSTSFSKTIKSKFTTLPTKMCKEGDLILCVRGSTTGRMNIAGFDACIGRGVAAIRSKIYQDYLNIFIDYNRYQIHRLGTGSTFPNVSADILNKIDIPLPPLNEQRRLVTKIESLKARTACVFESLSTIPALLDQFRQSVLAAAFCGTLTADWREDNLYLTKDWYANKVNAVREKNLETKKQGRLWGSGISVKEVDVSWKQLPSTWNWVKVVDLGYDPDNVVQIGPMSMKSQDFTETGTIVLNVGCVQWDGLNLDKCNYLPPDRAADFDRYRVYKEDILFTRSGYVGRCAIVPPEVDGSLMTFHLLRVRTSPDICIPEYLYFAIRGCKAIKNQIEQSAIGATRAGFNTKLLQNIWLPLPPPQEQAQIIQEIKKQFKLLGSLNNQVNDIENTLNQLDQSILAQAFRGTLVPQDPNDEPASVLLERIRAEREKNTGATSKRSKKSADTSPSQTERSTGATKTLTNKSTPFKEAIQMELELE